MPGLFRARGILLGHNLFGSTEFAYRFSTGLAFFLTCILIFLLGSSFSGRYREGFWASIIYSTMALTFSAANFITMDTTLTFFTTLSMFAFWQSIKPYSKHSNTWKMILCLAVGFGFLTKGPAALIPAGAMFVYLLLRRKVISYFLTPWALPGVLLFCISGLSWYVYISLKLPGAAEYFIDNQFLGRLVTDKYQRNPGLHGAFIYLPVIFLGAMPWAADWFRKSGIFSYFKRSSWKAMLKNPESLFIACWIIIPMTVLCQVPMA